jgi:hypothetical protein
MFEVICVDEQQPQKLWNSLAKSESINITIESKSFLFQNGSFKTRQELPDCIDLLIIHESVLSSNEKQILQNTLCQEQCNFHTLLVSHGVLGIQNFSNFKVHYSNIPFPNRQDLSHLSDILFQLIDKLKNSNSSDEMNNAWHLWENPYGEGIITALNILCQGYLIACHKMITSIDSPNGLQNLSDFDISNPNKYCLEEEVEQYYQYSENPSLLVCDAISYMKADTSKLEIAAENVYGEMKKIEYWQTPFAETFNSRQIITKNGKLNLFQEAWNYSRREVDSTLDEHVKHLFKFVAGNSEIKLYPSIIAKAYLAINNPNYVI